MNKEDNNKPAQSFSFNFTFILAMMLAFNVVYFLLLKPFEPKHTSYSEFLRAVEEGRVTEVAIGTKDVVWRENTDGTTADTALGTSPMQFHADRIPGMDDSSVLAKLKESNVEFLGVPPNTFWSSLISLLLPVALLIGFWYWMYTRMGGASKALSIGKSKARVWDQSSERVTFKEVAGANEAVEELNEVVDFLKEGERYKNIGAKIPKGILLCGPPGTGKTLLAKATAGEAGVPFFSMSGADFIEMFVGVGAARVRDLFKQAREKSPCIIFIDEIDTIGRSRGGAKNPYSNDEREQTLNQLLVEMDGFDSSQGVILMAATNRPEVLDKALMRPGRFDRQVTVDVPDLKGREAILKVHTQKVKLANDVDLRKVAARTPGFAGADLANIINEAALLAVRGDSEQIAASHIDEATDRVMAGTERKSRALSPKEKEIVAYHEIGHAMLGSLLEHADPVHKVSIIPRGSAALGVTIQLPMEDRYLLTKDELNDRIAVLLAGRAAEEIRFDHLSTGASDDLQRATALARRMIVHFGMNEKIGPVALEEANKGFLGDNNMLGGKQYSEETAKLIDVETKAIVASQYERTKSILTQHKAAFEALSERLLHKEVMSGDEVLSILQEFNIEAPERSYVTSNDCASKENNNHERKDNEHKV